MVNIKPCNMYYATLTNKLYCWYRLLIDFLSNYLARWRFAFRAGEVATVRRRQGAMADTCFSKRAGAC
jgi:hypothetical protein